MCRTAHTQLKIKFTHIKPATAMSDQIVELTFFLLACVAVVAAIWLGKK